MTWENIENQALQRPIPLSKNKTVCHQPGPVKVLFTPLSKPAPLGSASQQVFTLLHEALQHHYCHHPKKNVWKLEGHQKQQMLLGL